MRALLSSLALRLAVPSVMPMTRSLLPHAPFGRGSSRAGAGIPSAQRGRTSSGALLVAALVLVLAVGAGSLWYASSDGGSGDAEGDSLSGGGEDVRAPGLPRSPKDRRPRAGAGAVEEDDDPDDILHPGFRTGDGRDPEGEVFTIDEESLRKVLRLRVWEELLRQLDEWQAGGKEVPRDVVDSLLALLRDDGLRLDAVAALGRVQSDYAGSALAGIAGDQTATEAVRIAALDALTRSGQKSGLFQVIDIAKADMAGPIGRRAFFALAAMGAEGVPFLLKTLDEHPDDEATDALVSALARAKDADAALADSMRTARADGDVRRIETLLRLATQSAERTGPALRGEVLQILRNLESVAWRAGDDESRSRIYASTISVAAGLGGDAYAEVVRIATGPKGDIQNYAAYTLSRGKGDADAVALAASLRSDLDPFVRAMVLQALGGTGSKKATAPLVAALDDPDAGVRRAAATGIAQSRDADALDPILARVASTKGDFDLARTYVDAIGRICVKKGLPKLEELSADPDPFWRDLEPFIRRAVARIESGNPDAQRLK